MSCLGSHEHRFDPSPPPSPPLPGSGLNPDFPGLSPDQAAEKGPRPLPAGQPYRLVAMARSGLGIHTPCAAYMFISEFGKLTATRVRIRTHALSPLACGSMVDRLGTPDALGNQSPQKVNHFATALGVPGQGSPLPAPPPPASTQLLQPKNGVCAGAPTCQGLASQPQASYPIRALFSPLPIGSPDLRHEEKH